MNGTFGFHIKCTTVDDLDRARSLESAIETTQQVAAEFGAPESGGMDVGDSLEEALQAHLHTILRGEEESL